jgi:chromosome segregation ATPase
MTARFTVAQSASDSSKWNVIDNHLQARYMLVSTSGTKARAEHAADMLNQGVTDSLRVHLLKGELEAADKPVTIGELFRADKRIDVLKVEIKALEASINSRDVRINNLGDEIGGQQRLIERLENKVKYPDISVADVFQSNKKVGQLLKELQAGKNRNEEIYTKFKRQEIRNESLCEKLAEARKDSISFKDRTIEQEAYIDRLIKRTGERINALLEEIKDLEWKWDDASGYSDKLKKENKDLTESYDAKSAYADKLKRGMVKKDELIGNLYEGIAKVKIDLANYKDLHANQCKMITQYQDKVCILSAGDPDVLKRYKKRVIQLLDELVLVKGELTTEQAKTSELCSDLKQRIDQVYRLKEARRLY